MALQPVVAAAHVAAAEQLEQEASARPRHLVRREFGQLVDGGACHLHRIVSRVESVVHARSEPTHGRARLLDEAV